MPQLISPVCFVNGWPGAILMAAESGRHGGYSFSPPKSPFCRISICFTHPLLAFPDGFPVLSSMAQAPSLAIGRCSMSTAPSGGTDVSAARTRYGPLRELMHSAAWRVCLSNCGSQGPSREAMLGPKTRNHWKASHINYADASLESPSRRANIGNRENPSSLSCSDRRDQSYQSLELTSRV